MRTSLVSGLGGDLLKIRPRYRVRRCTDSFVRGVMMEFLHTCSGLCFALGTVATRTVSLPLRT